MLWKLTTYLFSRFQKKRERGGGRSHKSGPRPKLDLVLVVNIIIAKLLKDLELV